MSTLFKSVSYLIADVFSNRIRRVRSSDNEVEFSNSSSEISEHLISAKPSKMANLSS